MSPSTWPVRQMLSRVSRVAQEEGHGTSGACPRRQISWAAALTPSRTRRRRLYLTTIGGRCTPHPDSFQIAVTASDGAGNPWMAPSVDPDNRRTG